MALTAVLRLPARALLRPWALLRGVALGRTEAAAGIRNGARRFGSQHVLVEPAAAAGLPQCLLQRPGPEGAVREEPGPLRRVLEGRAGDVVAVLPVQPGAGRRHQREWPATQRPCWLAGGQPSGWGEDVAPASRSPQRGRGRSGSPSEDPRFKDSIMNTIGHRATEQALQLGSLLPPAEALQVGMVDQVVPEDQLLSTALSVMAKWLAVPDHARQLTKSMIRQATADRLLKQRDADIQNFVSFISKDAIQKSLQTYLEKLKQKKG